MNRRFFFKRISSLLAASFIPSWLKFIPGRKSYLEVTGDKFEKITNTKMVLCSSSEGVTWDFLERKEIDDNTFLACGGTFTSSGPFDFHHIDYMNIDYIEEIKVSEDDRERWQLLVEDK